MLISSTAFSLSSATTSVTILAPPEITNLAIINSNDISCSWEIIDYGDEYFSDLIWLKDGEFFSEEQLICLDCESSIPSSLGTWTCMLTVRDSNGLETSISAFTVVSSQSPTGFITVDADAFTELITQFIDMLAGAPEVFSMIGDFFS